MTYFVSGISEEATDKIRSFTDLNAWKQGHVLVLVIYEITKTFPKEELYSLTKQLRRAVISVTSNIAEGFSRNTPGEKNQAYGTAMGSLTEVQNQLLISKDLNYLSEENFAKAATLSVTVSKLLRGLLKHVQNQIQNT